MREGPAHGTRSRRGDYPDSSTEILRAAGAPDKDRNQPNHDWPFTINDFYRWKALCPPFLENPSKLIGLLESLLINHQPMWDDCQQLLKIFLTAEERDLVKIEARKLVPGPTGVPTKFEPLIDAAFPLIRPEWDYNTYEGKRNLLVYRQVLLAGLRAATHANRSKIYAVTQRADERPAAFMERLEETVRRYTLYDPQSQDIEVVSMMMMAFVFQSAPDIREKLLSLDCLREMNVWDLVLVAEKVCDNRVSAEERQKEQRKTQQPARVCTATEGLEERGSLSRHLAAGEEDRKPKGKNQCAYCKEEGHWVKACPRKAARRNTKVWKQRDLDSD